MDEHLWVVRILWRCTSYAFGLALCFCTLAVAFSPLFFVLGIPDSIMVAVLGSTLIGFVGGAIAGFYSPPNSRDGSFLSSVFEASSVGFGRGALGGLICGIIFSIIFNGSYGLLIAFFVAFVGQGWGIWQGINRTINQVRKEREGAQINNTIL